MWAIPPFSRESEKQPSGVLFQLLTYANCSKICSGSWVPAIQIWTRAFPATALDPQPHPLSWSGWNHYSGHADFWYCSHSPPVITVTLGLFCTDNKMQNSYSTAEDEAHGFGQCNDLLLVWTSPSSEQSCARTVVRAALHLNESLKSILSCSDGKDICINILSPCL